MTTAIDKDIYYDTDTGIAELQDYAREVVNGKQKSINYWPMHEPTPLVIPHDLAPLIATL